jgi:hypothetical protein
MHFVIHKKSAEVNCNTVSTVTMTKICEGEFQMFLSSVLVYLFFKLTAERTT